MKILASSKKKFKAEKMPAIAAVLPDHFNFDERNPPKFLCKQGWLADILSIIESLFDASDYEHPYKIAPLGISRCSRGGKTRCLHEIASEVQKRVKDDLSGEEGGIFSETVILMVSFNGRISPIEEEEKKFPLFALTRRIFFALSGVAKTEENFNEFRKYDITAEQVSKWLKGKKCLLLIDELNNLDLKSENLKAQNIQLGRLLTKEFISTKGRCFVFSTHKITTGMDLSNYMENNSDRGFHMAALPLIPSLAETVNEFGSVMDHGGALTAPFAVYCGLVPGLIYMETIATKLPGYRLERLLDTFLSRNPKDADMVKILESVLDGNKSRLEKFPELFQLMDTTSNQQIRWIPQHLCSLLHEVIETSMETQISPKMLQNLKAIRLLFHKFKDAKCKSGDSWEALFAVMTLIRVMTCQGCDLLNLSNYIQAYEDYEVCYNWPLNMEHNTTLDEITKPSDLLTCIRNSEVSQPTVGIYYPTHASFETYDLIVQKWGKNGKVLQAFGYQLKEGAEIPASSAPKEFDKSYVIRGKSAKNEYEARGWNVASTEQLDEFFGVSGAEWTPEKWEKLNQSKNSTGDGQELINQDDY